MFLYVDQLEKQLDKEEFQEIGSMASLKVLETQFQMFIKSRMYLDDEFVKAAGQHKRARYKKQTGNDAPCPDDADIRPIYDEEPIAKGNRLYNHVKPSLLDNTTAFKSERLRISKPWFASQVDVNNDLSKPVTYIYLPRKENLLFANLSHMIEQWLPSSIAQ
ncbi:hypothetical protein Tco_0674692 [Tanacetum coccineum]